MQTCIITPISGLERYAKLSNTHLILAHIRDQRYMDFYKERGRQGDVLILDNGAYEGQVFEPAREFQLIDFYQPNIVVLPDSPGKGGEITFKNSMYFLNTCIKKGYKQLSYMAVPQAFKNDWYDWWNWTLRFLAIKEINCIGISKLLPKEFIGSEHSFNSYTRTEIALRLKALRSDIYLHALGMLEGNLIDYNYCKTIYNSLDTSVPVGRGYYGVRMGGEWDNPPLDFQMHFPKNTEAIEDNLRVMGIDPEEVPF